LTAPSSATPALSKKHQAQLLAAQSFMAFDFGTRRIGVATGNRISASTQALGTIATPFSVSAQQVVQLCLQQVRTWQPQALIVGLPTHADGAAHEMTQRAIKFACRLYEAAQMPVVMADERYSSVDASSENSKDLDAESARVILQRHFDVLDDLDTLNSTTTS
jgi:putative Holliday junction resolvase